MFSFIKNHKITLLILLLLYISNDTVLFGTNRNVYFPYIQYTFLLFLFVILLVYVFKKKKIDSRSIFCLFTFSLISILCIIFKDVLSFKYFYEILLMFIAILITSIISFDSFKKNYVYSIIIVSVLSFIPFLINVFFQSFLTYFPTIYGKLCDFHYLFVGVVPYNKYLFNIYRNYAFFREPGIFGCFLNLGLIFSLFFEENKINYKTIVILMLASISTLSTGSIITSIVIIISYVITQKFSNSKIVLILLLSFVLLIISNSTYLNDSIFGKITTNNGSLYSRKASIFSNILIASNNPILGDGWESLEESFEQTSTDIYGSSISHGEYAYHNTNTLLKILSLHGFLYFLIYLIGLYYLFFYNCKSISKALIVLICFILCISSEDLTLNIIIPILFYYGVTSQKVKHGGKDLSENY